MADVHEEPGYAFATPRHLRRLTSERRLPFTKFGGRVMIDLNDIDEMLERQRVEAAS